jgi:deazaflavin-dependent oxidoreductase (nitroreductase family)
MMSDHKEYNHQLIEEFRATRSNVGGPMPGRPLLLLTTTGAKSGQRRTTPLMYIPDGDRFVVFASNIGAPTTPDWCRNLMAHPNVTIEVGTETFDGTARVTEGSERERLWSTAIQSYPFFTDHQAKTTREIPVIVLERQPG